MKLSEVAMAVKGELVGQDGGFTHVSTDTRSLKTGALFIALKGDNFNGEAFVERAAELGACAALVSRLQQDLAIAQIVVDNTTIALGQLAHYKRGLLKGNVVAITGSCGKTSVRGMLQSVLEQSGSTAATRGNFNNQIGVPLTILASDVDVDYLVVEAGTSGKGEIKYLTEIISPDVAVVTNVHPAHLLGFGSLAAIAEEKANIYSAGDRPARAVVNIGLSGYSAVMDKLQDQEAIVFSANDGIEEDVRGTSVTASKVVLDHNACARFQLSVRGRTEDIALNVPGAHQVENAMAAAACAIALGVDVDLIRDGLALFEGEKSRMQLHLLKRGTLIDDSYNANPGSMKAAIDYLALKPKTILVLGDMGELGPGGEEEHKAIGAYAADSGVHELLVVGLFAEDYAEGFGRSTKVFRTHDDIVFYLKSRLDASTTVLVKGSHSSRMDLVCQGLLNSEGEA